jgi:hypothetical protein
METALAAGPGRPRARPAELPSAYSPKAVANAVIAAADMRFDSAVNPFHNGRLVPLVLDAVTT